MDPDSAGIANGDTWPGPFSRIASAPIVTCSIPPPPHEAVDEPARRGGRSADGLREVGHGRRPAVGEHIERGELREAEAQLAELGGEPDHELAPQRPAHRHTLADL